MTAMIKKTSWRPLPDFLTIKQSKIEGLGVFAKRDLPEGFDLGISHIFDERFQMVIFAYLLGVSLIIMKSQTVMLFCLITTNKSES